MIEFIVFFNCALVQVESKLILSSKLSVEGPVRMREEYFEGLPERPTVIKEAVAEQLRGALGQAVGTVQQLSVPLRDVMSRGMRVPLSKHFKYHLALKDTLNFIDLVFIKISPDAVSST